MSHYRNGVFGVFDAFYSFCAAFADSRSHADVAADAAAAALDVLNDGSDAVQDWRRFQRCNNVRPAPDDICAAVACSAISCGTCSPPQATRSTRQ